MNKKEKQISRVTRMEKILDELTETNRALSDALDKAGKIRADVGKLSRYYGSPDWRQDLDDDEAGLLPPDLKRGVLSQDGAYNALTEYRTLLSRMLDTVASELRRGNM
ncbi:MAG: DUF4298 domain-containing protein [Clostridia bacterium]|nr:DUF4298 domain-containing protein [Clostridia bacterium]